MYSQPRIQLRSFATCRVDEGWRNNGSGQPSIYHHVHFALDGSAYWTYNTLRIPLSPGHAYWAPANMPLGYSCSGSYTHIFAVFDIQGMNEHFVEQALTAPVELGNFDLDFVQNWDRGKQENWQTSYFESFLLHRIIQHWPGYREVLKRQHTYESSFHDVLEHIHNHISADLRIRDLADLHGMSHAAFTRTFRAVIGQSPKAYVNRVLHQRARKLIVESDSHIKEIASQLAFNDEYYFNRFFKKHNGLAPLEYRKEYMSLYDE